MELQSLIGNGVVRGDVQTFPAYDIINCAIESVRELTFSDEDAGFTVVCRGYYLINSLMWL